MPGTALLYARVSTDETRQESLPAQLAMARARARAEGLTVVGEYRDTISRAIFARPGLSELLARVRTGAATHVIVWQTSRLYGDVEQKVKIYRALREREVVLMSAAGEVENLPGAMSEAMSSLRAVLHQLEVDTTRERVHDLHIERARVGEILQRPVYGIAHEGERGFYVHPRQVEVVREVFTALAAGARPGEVAERLNARGERTLAGGPWHVQAIRRMSRNRIYVGELVWNRTRTVVEDDRRRQVARPREQWITSPSPLGALVDPALFDAAGAQQQVRHRERGGTWGAGVRRYPPRLLAGLVWCARCGRKMYARRNGRVGNTTFYFTCARQCQTIAERKLMATCFTMGEQGALTLVLREPDTTAADAEAARTELASVKRLSAKNYQAYLEDLVEEEDYRETAGWLRARREAAHERLAAATSPAIEREDSGEVAALLAGLFDDLVDEGIDLEVRRTLVAHAVERIVLDRPTVAVYTRPDAGATQA